MPLNRQKRGSMLGSVDWTAVGGTGSALGSRMVCDDKMPRSVFLARGALCEQGHAADFLDHPATPEAAAFLRGDLVI